MRRQSQITGTPSVRPGKEAVGVASVSRGPQIIAAGAQKLIAGFQEREAKADNLSAMARYGDWGREYAIEKEALRKEHRESPKDFPKAAQDLGTQMSTRMSEGLNRGAAKRFKEITTNTMAQDADNNVNWSIGREQELVVGDIDKGFADLPYAAEFATGVKGLQQLLYDNGNGDMFDAFSLEAQAMRARDFLSPATVEAKKKATRTSIVENAMNASMLNDPRAAYVSIAKREYQGVLTPNEEKTYLARAKTMMVNQAVVDKFKKFSSASVEVSEMIDSVSTTGGMTTAEIAGKIAWAETNKDAKDADGNLVISPNLLRNYYAIRDLSLDMDSRTAKEKTEDSKAYAEGFVEKWDNFLLSRGEKKEAEPDDYDEVLGMYADLTRAYQSGIIKEHKFKDLRHILNTKLKMKLGKKFLPTASLSEAQAEAGKWRFWGWKDKPNDIYSKGYDHIWEYVKKERKDLGATAQQDLKENMILAYMDTIAGMDEDTVNNIKHPDVTARKILFGGGDNIGLIHKLNVFTNSDDGRSYKYGDIYTAPDGSTGRVSGMRDGDLFVVREAEFMKGVRNR